MIESITAISSADLTESIASQALKQGNDIKFGDFLTSELQKVDSSLQQADMSIRSLAAGADIPIHDVMIQIESARMSLMLVSEVRNRAVEAYQELMRMQL